MSVHLKVSDGASPLLDNATVSYVGEQVKVRTMVAPESFWNALNADQEKYKSLTISSFASNSDHYLSSGGFSGYGEWNYIDLSINVNGGNNRPITADTRNTSHLPGGAATLDLSLATPAPPDDLTGDRLAGTLGWSAYPNSSFGDIRLEVSLDYGEYATALPDNTAVSQEFRVIALLSAGERATGDWVYEYTLLQEARIAGSGTAQMTIPTTLTGVTVDERPAENGSYQIGFEVRHLFRPRDDGAGNLGEAIAGDGGDNRIDGGVGNDVIFGRLGNDVLIGGIGDDVLDGGQGTDIATWTGPRRMQDISINMKGDTSVFGLEGMDTVRGVEHLVFADGRYVTDTGDTAAQVFRLYGAALGRAPEPDGLLWWKAALDAGDLTLARAADGFVGSDEFRFRYGPLDDRGFVEQLYRNVLHREGEETGVAGWTGALGAGLTRAEALMGFSESAENVQRTAPVIERGLWLRDDQAAAVARLYDSAFDRLPDAGGLVGWTGAVKAGMTLHEAAAGFIGSAEFQQRYGAVDNAGFVDLLYRNVLDRQGDPDGLRNWTGALDAGMTRTEALVGFSESVEHRMQRAPYIDDGIWVL